MKLRFTIRELLLVTIIVALALGWWIDRHATRSWRVTANADGTIIEDPRTGERLSLRDGMIVHSGGDDIPFAVYSADPPPTSR